MSKHRFINDDNVINKIVSGPRICTGKPSWGEGRAG